MCKETCQECCDSNRGVNTRDNLHTHNSIEGRLNQLFPRKPNVLHEIFEKKKLPLRAMNFLQCCFASFLSSS